MQAKPKPDRENVGSVARPKAGEIEPRSGGLIGKKPGEAQFFAD